MTFSKLKAIFFSILGMILISMPSSHGFTDLRDVSAINHLYLDLGSPSVGSHFEVTTLLGGKEGKSVLNVITYAVITIASFIVVVLAIAICILKLKEWAMEDPPTMEECDRLLKCIKSAESNIPITIIKHSGSSLCEDMLQEIFKRLPTKSTLKFTSLSKFCRRSLNHPYFRKSHYNRFLHDTNPPTQPLFTTDYWKRNDIVVSMNMNLEEGVRKIVIEKEMLNGEWFNQEWTNDGYRVANSCNGLVLFKPNDKKQPLILCNPLTLHYSTKPFCINYFPSFFSVGLGFSLAENEYKLVGIESSSENIHRIMVRELSVDDGRWRFRCNFEYFPCRGPIYVHGNMFWICRSPPTQQLHMICFNVEDETVREIENAPAVTEGIHVSMFSFVEFAGLVTVAYVKDFVLKIYVLCDLHRSQWELKYSIKLPNMLKGMNLEKVWDNNGKIHILMGKLILMYDEKKEEGERISLYAIARVNNNIDWKLCSSYKPSFGSLDERGCDVKVGSFDISTRTELAPCIYFTRQRIMNDLICSKEDEGAKKKSVIKAEEDVWAMNKWIFGLLAVSFILILSVILNMF